MTDVIAIAQARPRDVVAVRGRIASVRVEPRDAAPCVTARVQDETGAIDAVFMGRREILGIEPGVVVDIEGRVCPHQPVARVYNPTYVVRQRA